MNTLFSRIATEFDPAPIAQRIAAWLPDLAIALLTLLAFWLVHRVSSFAITAILRRSEVDATAIAFVQAVLRYALGAIATVTALGQIGVDTGSLLASLGVVGLTIGFAARDALSNVISGLFIFWDRPFVIGDLVEIQGTYGRVETITMRSTRLVTVDGKMIAIPNAVAVNTPVVSYTNFPKLRVDIDVTISVNEDIGRARKLMLDLCTNRPGFEATPPPSVVVTALNDYNVALQLRAWIADERAHIPARFALREDVFETLTKAGVDMPFETIAVLKSAA